MPGKRKRSRKYERKTTVYRKKRKRSRKFSVPKGLFAKKTRMHFRYADTITLDPGIGATMTYHSFCANGMYDPDLTGAGHQPRGFDQYMQFYQHYTVIASKITATFCARDATAQGQCYVSVITTPNAAPGLTGINDIQELSDAKNRLQTVMGTRPRIIRHGCNLSKYLGQKVLQEDANAGTAGSNPFETVYFQVMAGSNNVGVTDPTSMQVNVVIDYIAILHEPKLVAGS